MSQNKPSRPEKPAGFWGRLGARLMGLAHRSIYKAVAAALELKAEDTFLDVGCGSGIFIKKFAPLPQRVAGLDHSKDMVKLAAGYNRKRVKAGRAEFKLGDAAKIPWGDQSFSAAAMIETFYWLKPLETLKEIYRILRPNGRVVIGLGLNADDGKDRTKYARSFNMKFYSEKEMRILLEQAGFKNISFTFAKGLGMPRIMIAKATKGP